MRILIVDDEMIAIKNLEYKLKQIDDKYDTLSFLYPLDALEYVKKMTIDVALLDINMHQMSGLNLAKNIKEIAPNCAIIFTTGYSEFAVEAFALKVSGFLVKPIELDDLKRELEHVSMLQAKVIPADEILYVKCFGNFEVFSHGEPLKFSRQKSKELFAYLVDRRGSQSTMAEIASILWEDGKYDSSRNSQIHNFLADITKTLSEVSNVDIIIRKRNAISIDTSKLYCDAYECLGGNPAVINSYMGEYMAQYSWAEFGTMPFDKLANFI